MILPIELTHGVSSLRLSTSLRGLMPNLRKGSVNRLRARDGPIVGVLSRFVLSWIMPEGEYVTGAMSCRSNAVSLNSLTSDSSLLCLYETVLEAASRPAVVFAAV